MERFHVQLRRQIEFVRNSVFVLLISMRRKRLWLKKKKTEDDSLRRRLARSKRKREERKSDREFFGTESLVTKDLKKESAKDWIERTKKNSTIIKKQKIETTTKTYESRDLKGIALAHSLSEFKEGETILTLRDTGVLDEDGEDMLENINMTDYDRDAEREERRKKASRPVYVLIV